MMLETLHYEDEIRKSDPFLQASRRQRLKELVSVATELIARKTVFDAGQFKDHLAALAGDDKKQEPGQKIRPEAEEPSAARKGNVIDLMSALNQPENREKEDGAGQKELDGGPTDLERLPQNAISQTAEPRGAIARARMFVVQKHDARSISISADTRAVSWAVGPEPDPIRSGCCAPRTTPSTMAVSRAPSPRGNMAGAR